MRCFLLEAKSDLDHRRKNFSSKAIAKNECNSLIIKIRLISDNSLKSALYDYCATKLSDKLQA